MGDACDCAPNDSAAFFDPWDVERVEFQSDRATMTWIAQPGVGTTYDVVYGTSAELPVQDGGGIVCLDSELGSPSVVHATAPSAGTLFWYLVRAENVCDVGSYGERSVGVERSSAVCP